MDKSPVGANGMTTVWMAGGPLDGLAYSDMPLFENGQPGVSVAIPIVRDDGTEYFVNYTRRSEPSDDERWFYDYVSESENAPGTEPQTLPVGSVTSAESREDDAAVAAQNFTPDERFIVERAWWIASELKRRHPGLRVGETFPLNGFYHGLEIGVDTESWVFMNFVGSVHRSIDGELKLPGLPWTDPLSGRTPHEFIKKLEKEMKWKPAGASTTPATLIYRVISALVTERLNDRHTWDAGNSDGVNLRAGKTYDSTSFLAPFKGAMEAETATRDGLPLGRYWAIQQNGEVRAILHESGSSYHVHRPPINLFALYRARRRLRDATEALSQALDEI